MHQEIPEELDSLAKQVVDAGFHVHRELGPGLLESAYHACLQIELTKRGIPFRTELELPIEYGGLRIERGFRLDLLVDGQLVVELKSVEELLPVHHAQLLTYLKLGKFRLGLLINFNSRLFKEGVKRIAL